MTVNLTDPIFNDEDKARAYFEDIRWPRGVVCPHCGESFPLQVDTSQSQQTLIEDCSVCCRPIVLKIHCQPGEITSVFAGAA